MARRIYTKSSGSPAVTPTTWNFATQLASPVTVPGTLVKNDGSAMNSAAPTSSTTNPHTDGIGRTVIGPLTGGTAITGTVKGQMRCSESNAGANADLWMAIKVITPAGADRGVLLAAVGSSNVSATPPEMATSLTNRRFLNASDATPITLTSVTPTAGDYLVIEWGVRTGTTVARAITMSYGNNSATDLAENDTATTADNPWWEFSQDIGFNTILTPTIGDASATGLAASLGRTLGALIGNASAVGLAATLAFAVTVGPAVGNASAAGLAARTATAAVATVGDAAATGIAASLSVTGGGTNTVITVPVSRRWAPLLAVPSSGGYTYFAVGTVWTPLAGGINTTSTFMGYQTPLRTAGTLRAMSVNLISNTFDGGITIGLNRAGSVTIVALVGAGTTGYFEDVTHEEVASAGDLVGYVATVGGTSGLALIGSQTIQFAASDGTAVKRHEANGGGINGGVDIKVSFAGYFAVTTTDAASETRLNEASTFRNLALRLNANTTTGSTTLTDRYWGGSSYVDGALSLTVPTATTGTYEDLTHTDTFIAGDRVLLHLVTTGSNSLNATACVVEQVKTATRGVELVGSGDAFLGTTTLYLPVAGTEATWTSYTQAATKQMLAGVFSKLRVNVTASTIGSSAGFFTLLTNATAHFLSAFILSATTGWFEDLVDTVQIQAGDDAAYRWGGANSGSATLGVNTILFTPALITVESAVADGLAATISISTPPIIITPATGNATATGLAPTVSTAANTTGNATASGFAPSLPYLSVAFDAAADGGSTTGSSLTWAHTCTGENRGLRVDVSHDATPNITGVTYDGVAMTQVGAAVTTVGGLNLLTYYLPSPHAGTHNVVVSKSAATGRTAGISQSHTGTKAIAPEATATSTGSASSRPVSVTTLSDRAWASGATLSEASDADAGTLTTERVSDTGASWLVGGDSNAATTPAGSVTLTFVDVAGVVRAPATGTATATGLAASLTFRSSLTPAVGDASAAGLAPAVKLAFVLSPATGTASAAGFTPSVGGQLNISPAVGSASATGLAPTLQFRLVLTPAVGDASASGLAPLRSTTFVLVPATGTASATGLAPTISTIAAIVPAVGTASAAGFAPSVVQNLGRVPAVGDASATGLAPLIQPGKTPALGDASASGLAARLATTLIPATGSASAAGLQPNLGGALVIGVPQGTATADGLAPTLILRRVLVPAAGDASASGLAPLVGTTFGRLPGTGDASASGLAPALRFLTVLVPATGTASAAGLAPSFSGATTISPAVGTASATGLAARLATVLIPASGDATATGLAPLVGQAISRLPAVGDAAASGLGATLALRVVLVPAVGTASAAGFAPTLAKAAVPAPGDATASGLAARLATVVVVPTGSASAAGFTPSAGGQFTITTPVGNATATGLAPQVLLRLFSFPPAGDASASGVAARVSLTLTPATGSALADGLSPAGGTVLTRTPPTGTASATGLAPALITRIAATPATGDATATGLAARIAGSGTPAPGPAAASGLAASLEIRLTPATGTASATGLVATKGVGFVPTTGSATASGLAAHLLLVVRPATGNAVASGLASVFRSNLFPPISVATLEPLLNNLLNSLEPARTIGETEPERTIREVP